MPAKPKPRPPVIPVGKQKLPTGINRPDGGYVITSHQNVSSADLSATQDIEMIKQTLRDIMADVTAPAAAKAQAARTLAEMHQALGRFSGAGTESNKPVKETSRADLEAELAAIMGHPGT